MTHKLPYREGDEPPAGHMLVSDEEGNKHWVRPEDLKKSPLRHDGIAPELLNVIRWQWRHLAPHSPAGCQSFEAWERGFLRDAHPEREIAIWMRLTYAWLEFTHRNPGTDAKTVLQALLHISAGRGDSVKPRTVRRELEKLCRQIPARFSDPDNFTEDGQLKGGGHLE